MNLYVKTTRARELDDKQLVKVITDYLECPERYHPEYLKILTTEYERRIKLKLEQWRKEHTR
jgi:hypothetical protein